MNQIVTLTKQTFAQGIKLINAVLGKNCQLDSKETLDSYYLLLQDLPDQLFLQGVVNLMKNWDNPHFKPGPGEIRKQIETIMYCGLTKEEFVLVAKTFKETNHKFINHDISNLLETTDLKEILVIEHKEKN